MISLASRWFLIFIFLAVWQPVYAEDLEDPVVYDFKYFDEDGNGLVSYEEFLDGVKITTFERLDKNGDKVILREEWSLVDQTPESAVHFGKMDLDRDGGVNFPEYSEAVDEYSNAKEVFVTADIDLDGNLTIEEFRKQPGLQIFTILF